MANYGETKNSYAWEDRKQWLDLPFPVEEYHQRVDRIRAGMAGQGLDFLLVYGNATSNGVIRYLANFDPFFGNAIVLVDAGDPVLITDGIMHSEPMHSTIWTTWIRDVRAGNHPATVRHAANLSDFVVDLLRERNLLDSHGGLSGASSMPYGLMMRLKELAPDLDLLPVDSIVEETRAIKSKNEIAALRNVAEITSVGIDAAIACFTPGRTELDIMAELIYALQKAGAITSSAALTSGRRAGLKHAPPTNRKVKNGDMYFMDVTVDVVGYVSDVARSGVVGEATQQQQRMLETALAMRNSVVAAVRPGARIKDLQSIAENIAAEAGLADYYYPTGFGHGIGTSVVQLPALFPDNEAPLEENMVFALEPMIVIPDVGTAVFEDMILVTRDGGESLSNASYQTW